MENVFIPVNTSLNNTLASAVAKAVPQPQEAKQTEINPAKQSSNSELNTRQQRDDAVDTVSRRLSLLKKLANLYAVSDTRFTIYKSGGEFYTRITSLRDGKVMVIPEPDFLSGLGSGALVETSV